MIRRFRGETSPSVGQHYMYSPLSFFFFLSFFSSFDDDYTVTSINLVEKKETPAKDVYFLLLFVHYVSLSTHTPRSHTSVLFLYPCHMF